MIEKYRQTATMLSDDIEAKFTYMLNYLSPTNQKIFDKELLKITTLDDIDIYAYELCFKLSTQYDSIQNYLKSSTTHAWSLFDHVTPGTVIGVSFVIIVIVGTLYYFNSSSIDAIKKSGELQGNINGIVSNISTNATKVLGTTAVTNADLGLQFQALSEVTKLQGDAILNLVDNNTTKILALEHKHDALKNTTEMLFQKCKALFKVTAQMYTSNTSEERVAAATQYCNLIEKL